jgi:hypothetical protein
LTVSEPTVTPTPGNGNRGCPNAAWRSGDRSGPRDVRQPAIPLRPVATSANHALLAADEQAGDRAEAALGRRSESGIFKGRNTNAIAGCWSVGVPSWSGPLPGPTEGVCPAPGR